MLKKTLLLFHKLVYKFYDLKSFYIKNTINSCGKNLKVFGPCKIKNPHNLIIGDNIVINDYVYINAYNKIVLGNNISLSAGCILVSTGLDTKSFINKKKHIEGDIIVGNNVQIGTGAIILANVKIGNNVIIGAGSVVNRDIEDNVVVAGVPAKILKRLN